MKKALGVHEYLFFVLSPLLAFPVIIRAIFKNKKNGLLLLALFYGIISYLYIPHFTNDKVRYLEDFRDYKFLDFDVFLTDKVSMRIDFLLHIIIFILSKIGLGFNFIISVVTTITVGIWLYVFDNFFKNFGLNNKFRLLGFLMLLIAISYSDLLSGIRFYFSFAFVLLAYYHYFIRKKNIFVLAFLFTAVFIHFSSLLFVIVLLFHIILRKRSKLLSVLVLLTLVFLIFNPSVNLSRINFFIFSDSLLEKKNAYFENEDLIESGIQNNISHLYIYIISLLWYIYFIYYSFFRLSKESRFKILVLLLIGLLSVLSSYPTVFSRYLLALKIISIVVIFENEYKIRRVKSINVLGFLFLLGLLTNLTVIRENIYQSYFNSYNLTLPTIILKIFPEYFI